VTYVTSAIAERVGVPGKRVSALGPLSSEELRRFVQATMNGDPIHWDEETARGRGFAGVVATPLFPMHAFRRPPETPDPLDRLKDDADWDGAGGLEVIPGLAPLDLSLHRVLNGGTGAEFFQLARVGDVISSQSRYSSVTEREGSKGPMVIAEVDTEYTNQDNDLLARVHMTLIYR
jgi:acyl dehydratase